MVIMDAALVLGIIGAATGCLGTALAFLSFARDRPRLEVTAEYPWTGDELSVFPVEVANHGRQPVAVTAVGFGFRSPPSWLRFWFRRLTNADRQYATGWATSDASASPVVLDPGHVHRATVEVTVWLGDEREPAVAIWACAWDSRGRRALSRRVLVAPGKPYRVVSDAHRSRPRFGG
jgi:hypothetical protein